MTLSFQTRIVLFFSALFFGVQILAIFCIYWISYNNAVAQLGQNLVYAEAVFKQLIMERGERIASSTRILVADFGFRSTISSGDTKTITSALENISLRIHGQRAFYVDLQGKTVADTAGRYSGSAFIFPDALAEAERQDKAVAFGVLDGTFYEWAVLPVLAPIPMGWVAVAVAVDQDMLERLKSLSALPIEVTLLEQSAKQTRVLASSLPENKQILLIEKLQNHTTLNSGEFKTLTSRGDMLLTRLHKLPTAAKGQEIVAVLQIDFAEALKSYWLMLYAAFGWMLLASILILLGSIGIAKKLSKPIRALAGASERMLAGQFESPLPVHSQDELGRIAKTFNRAAELATQIHELKQKDQLRREMVATVSHDLRNPLTALHGFLETLQLKASSLPVQEQQRFLEIALRQSEKVNRLAQELFELAKLECDETCLNLETFYIGELIQDIAQKYKLLAQQKGVSLLAPIRQGLPAITADIGLIERLLGNLVDNAISNTPSGGEIKIDAESSAGFILVSVTDTGIGIPANYLPTLFDWESPLSHRARADAGGFGLVIVAKILKLHGGSIEVQSTLGQGSEFRCLLPITPPPKQA